MAKSSRPPFGAAFSHGRKVAQKTGGGQKAERAAASAYLNKKGHKGVRKSHHCPLCAPLVKSRFFDAFTQLQAAAGIISGDK